MKRLLMTFVFAACAATGCQTQPPPAQVPVSTPIDQDTLEQLRDHFRAENADVVLARVARALATDDFLALDKASPSDFPVGTVLSVIDSNRNTLAHGKVVAIVNDEVHASFTTTGPRRPQEGDAVIVFKHP